MVEKDLNVFAPLKIFVPLRFTVFLVRWTCCNYKFGPT